MFRKLGWQLTTSFFVVILLAMALLGFYLLNRLDDLFTQDVQLSLRNEAQLVASVWAQYHENGPITQQQKRIVYNLCSMMTWQYGSRIRILDTKANVVMDTLADPNPVLKDRVEVLQALAGEEANATWEPDQEGDPPRVAIAFPVKVSRPSRGGAARTVTVGAVYVTRSLKLLHQVLHDLGMDFVVGTGLSVMFSGIRGIFLSRLLSSPLRRIAAAAEQMARGDMSAMVPVNSSNEIGELARSFNFMASELGRRTEELVEEKNKLSAVLTHMQGGALMVDEHGSILMKNRSAMAMLGLEDAAAVKRSTAFQSLVATAISSGSNGIQEVRLPNNRVAQVLWTPVRSEADEPLGYVILMNDITELRRVDEMKTEFVSNVSHELRTPLASIKGLAEILLDGALQEEEGKRFLRSINREINRLTRLVKDLLDLSKIEGGMVKFETLPVDLGELVTDVLQRMQSRLEAVTVETQADVMGAIVLADPDRVEQVVINLLDNAVRYTPTGGTIQVSARLQDQAWHLTIANQGSGIPQEELSKIFERFYRIDKHRSRDQGGTGLGLSISRHIIERLGGRIWAESDGHWTRFTFWLPAAPAVTPVAADQAVS